MKTIIDVNNEINDSCFGVVDSDSNRFNAFYGTTDEVIYNAIKNGKLVAKYDFDENEQRAWDTIFENYSSLLEEESSYAGLSVSDDDNGNRYYYLIWEQTNLSLKNKSNCGILMF